MANAFTLFGELKADTGNFKNSLRDADRALEATRHHIQSVEGKASDLGKNTAVTGRAFDKLRNNVEAARVRLGLTADAFEKGNASAGQMRAAMIAVERALGGVNSKLQDQSARLSDAASKSIAFSKAMDSVGNAVQSAGSALSNIGTKLTIGVTAPLTLAAKEALTAGSSYETALNIFAAVTNATTGEMGRAAQVAKDLGSDLLLPATSAKDAALAMVELGKAGLTAQQAMEGAKGVLQLAAAGQLGEARAAEIAANALNSFNLKATETGRVADLLAAAANASSAGVNDIALAMQQASATFAASKIPIEDLTTAIGLMANAGVKGSDAGTSLKTFLARLTPTTSDAAEAMESLGINAYDASGTMKPLTNIIGEFQNALKGLSDEQKATKLNDIFGSDAIRAAQILFREGTAGFEAMRKGVTELGAAGKFATAITKGVGGAWDGLTSQLETLGIEIFEAIKVPLADALRTVADFVGQATDLFKNSPQFVKILTLAFGAIAAISGPVLLAIGAIATAIGGVITTAGAIAGIVGAIGGFGVAVGIVAGVIAQVAIFVAGLAAAVTTLYLAWQRDFGGIKTFTLAAWESIKSATNSAMSFLSTTIGAVGGGIISWFQSNWPLIQQTIQTVSDKIKGTVQGMLNAISAFWTEHGDRIMSYVSAWWNTVSSVVSTGVGIVGNAVKIGMQLINGDWNAAWSSFLETVRTAAQGAVELVANIIPTMKNLLAAALPMILQWGATLSKAFTTAVGYAIASALKLLVTLPARLVMLIPKIFAAAKDIGVAIVRGVSQGLSDALSGQTSGGVSGGIGDDKGFLDRLLEGLMPKAATAGMAGVLAATGAVTATATKPVLANANTAVERITAPVKATIAESIATGPVNAAVQKAVEPSRQIIDTTAEEMLLSNLQSSYERNKSNFERNGASMNERANLEYLQRQEKLIEALVKVVQGSQQGGQKRALVDVNIHGENEDVSVTKMDDTGSLYGYGGFPIARGTNR